MVFDWATKGEDYTGTLSIKTMGVANGQATEVATNNATVTLVDVSGTQGTITEAQQGPTTQVNRSDAAASNAYVLPWKADHAVMTRLGAAQDIFVTTNLNGCAVFVGGDAADPVVMHVNSGAAILGKGEPEYNPAQPMNEAAAQMTAFQQSWKMPMWDAIYQALASRLQGMGRLPNSNVALLVPGQYLSAGTGSAAVFGRRDGGTWRFFWNANGRTTQFWPEPARSSR